jgi:DNA end-binding protein Ku
LINLHAPCAQKGLEATRSQQFTCNACGGIVSKEETVKGYKDPNGRYLLFTPAELEALAAEKTKEMELLRFVPANHVDPLYFGNADFLGPVDPLSMKGLALLRGAMQDTDRQAIVAYKGTNRDKIGLIRPFGTALMLHELYFPAEVRTFEGQARVPITPVTISPQEHDLAIQLVQASAAAAFDLSDLKDGYETRLTDAIAAKVQGVPLAVVEAAPRAQVVDLVAALQASLAARKPTAAAPSRTAQAAADSQPIVKLRRAKKAAA